MKHSGTNAVNQEPVKDNTPSRELYLAHALTAEMLGGLSNPIDNFEGYYAWAEYVDKKTGLVTKEKIQF